MTATLRSGLIWVIFAAVLVVLPLIFSSGGSITLLSRMGFMVVFALSYNMLLGQSGLLSFGHAVYFGLAGFVTVHALNVIGAESLPLPLPAVPLIGALAGLFFGALFGAVVTRRAGTVFAMITLGIGELVASSSLILSTFFGGEAGIKTDRTRALPLLGQTFGSDVAIYYLIAAWCFVSVLAMYGLTRTPFGRMCLAVRENPERVEFLGYSAGRLRYIAFMLSSLFAGVAGALAAINYESMNAVNLGAGESGRVLLMAFIGGIGVFWGPLLGAVLVVYLEATLSDITGAWILYFGLLFMLVVLFAPGGIAGWISMHAPAIRHRKLGHLAPPYALAAVPLALLAAGAILLIQLSQHMLVDARSQGSALRVFFIPMDGATPLPWIATAVLIVLGVLGTRAVWPRVTAAWGSVHSAVLEDAPG